MAENQLDSLTVASAIDVLNAKRRSKPAHAAQLSPSLASRSTLQSEEDRHCRLPDSSNRRIAAGILLVNDRILPDQEIGIKALTHFIGKLKRRLLKSTSLSSNVDGRLFSVGSLIRGASDNNPLVSVKRNQSRARNSGFSSPEVSEDSASGDSASEALLKRRRSDHECDGKESSDIVISMKDFELATQLYGYHGPASRTSNSTISRRLSARQQQTSRTSSANKSDDGDRDGLCPHVANRIRSSGAEETGYRMLQSGSSKASRKSNDHEKTPQGGFAIDFDAELLGEMIQYRLQQIAKRR